MKFALQINASPTHSQASWTAYRFAQTVLEQQHEIFRVFFYHDGSYHAFKSVTVPDDERSFVSRWCELAQTHSLDLVVCISAAQRRGLLSEEEIQKQLLTDIMIAKSFRLGGLGQLIEATLIADRFLVFG